MIFLDFIYLLSMTIWIGSIVFFVCGRTCYFQIIGPRKVGKLVGLIFPKYYLLGYVYSTLAMLIIAICLQSAQDWRLGLILTMVGSFLSAGIVF